MHVRTLASAFAGHRIGSHGGFGRLGVALAAFGRQTHLQSHVWLVVASLSFSRWPPIAHMRSVEMDTHGDAASRDTKPRPTFFL